MNFTDSDNSKPIVLYDGRCRFCIRQAAKWRELHGDQLEFRPLDSTGEEVMLCESQQREYRGAEAALRIMAMSGGWRRIPLWCYRKLPGFGAAAMAIYRLIARHRYRL